VWIPWSSRFKPGSDSALVEKIPGLGPLIEKLMENITVFVYTTLEVRRRLLFIIKHLADSPNLQPYLKPLLQTASTGLATSSAEVINTYDQLRGVGESSFGLHHGYLVLPPGI